MAYEKMRDSRTSGSEVELAGQRMFKIKGGSYESVSSRSSNKFEIDNYVFFNMINPGATYDDFQQKLNQNPPLLVRAVAEKEITQEPSEIDSLKTSKLLGVTKRSGLNPDQEEKASFLNQFRQLPYLSAKPQYQNLACPLNDAVSQSILSQNTANRTAVAQQLAPSVAKMLAEAVVNQSGQEDMLLPTMTSPMVVFLLNSSFSSCLSLSYGKPTLERRYRYVQETKIGRKELGTENLVSFIDEMSNQIRPQLEKELVARGLPSERAARYASLLARNGFQFSSLNQYEQRSQQLLQAADSAAKIDLIFAGSTP